LKSNNLINELIADYDHFIETSLFNKRFKYADILLLIKKLQENELFNTDKAGYSTEGEPIYKIRIGHGPTNILLWSQMHGDEPTATMALFDFFNFINNQNRQDKLLNKLLNKITFTIIPVLNPDGMNKFQRENSIGVDLNRDAKALQFPESKILMSLRDEIEPEFCFNLHDQSPRYSVGMTGKPTAIALLVPPFDYAKSHSPARDNGMKVIADINKFLQKIIPGQVARYEDEFEPRAFGDNFVKLGSSSILIEAGNLKNDIEKQEVRKIFFISMLAGFYSIADKTYSNNRIEEYFLIPQNEEIFFDLLLRNVTINNKGKEFIVDIGINHDAVYSNHEQVYYESCIEEIGDLSIYFGNEEIDLKGYKISSGKIYPDVITLMENLTSNDFESFYKNGYLALRSEEKLKEDLSSLPINFISDRVKNLPGIELGNSANFIITKSNSIEYVIVNGFIHKIDANNKSILNGIIFH